MKLTFWGAARQVTGSMFLLELEDGYTILIDCGTDLDKQKVERDKLLGHYSLFPFEPSQINLVLLTHAHIDHSGNLPNLIREGYEGQILCTTATLPLADLLLRDAAALNAKRVKELQSEPAGKKKKTSKKKFRHNPLELYLEKQVHETTDRFVTIGFNQKFKVSKTISVTFIPTGHLLGAANIVLDIEENGVKKSIGFSGDVGRKNYPLLPDPQRMPQVDYLVCESTYGGRRHADKDAPEEALAKIIKETCIDQPGRLIIPAFSVGRTQALLFVLNKLYTEEGLPPIKVFSDSPLALASTRVYEKNIGLLNKEAKEFYEEHEELFDFDNLTYVQDMKQSKAIANYNEPCIIISSSGMISGGRVEHHVMTNLPNPYATILLVGFAAEGTLGNKLLKGMRSLSISKDKEIPIMATIKSIDVFSGHGDLDDLTDFVEYQSNDKLKTIFLVHGELESMESFKSHLHYRGYTDIQIPKWGDEFEL
ncbi:MBL fold metallo-hydrolase [Cytophagaceae bacterium YF14B1]|uniref:MBL fold metallo-hydrolase n=1 Tax=Xanthocytophaga flava TaxID=3048013 RepID=A0AAE3QVR9_9BACT|nr:MBL fold metallo-hydrolase [Xanthocytophaga flavus]MDJ1473077.1 MBL fold metallo-hydrolase [Xanthocytophaga flavus]MDJ1484303.1 MBL fold metallo-hydrolase [Xanthocytophaga flavus]